MTQPAGAPSSGVPVGWVDVAARLVVQVGFPIVVAAVLLWFLLTRFQTNMDAITRRMEHNAEVVERLVDAMEAEVAEQQKQTAALRSIDDNLKAARQ